MDHNKHAEDTASSSQRSVSENKWDHEEEDKENALVGAVEKNDMKMAKELLQSGVTGSRRDSTGNTLLHMAARLSHPHLCALLVEHGADINARNKALFTPLFFAARANLQTVRVLLEAGADVRLRNHLGEIPLHAAASSGLIDVIVTLISWGSDVNTRCSSSSEQALLTPLNCAVGSGSRLAVKTLLRLGAEVNGGGVPVTQESTRITPQPVKKCGHNRFCVCENTDKPRDHHQQDVRVRVPRQEQICVGQLAKPVYPRSALSGSPAGLPCLRTQRQHRLEDSSVRGQPQCGVFLPDYQLQQHRACYGRRGFCQACQVQQFYHHHSQPKHGVDLEGDSSCVLSPFRPVFQEKESEDESLSEECELSLSVDSEMLDCYNGDAPPQCPLCGSVVCVSRSSLCHLQYSTCPLKEAEVQYPRDRTVSRRLSSEERSHPNMQTEHESPEVSELLKKADLEEEGGAACQTPQTGFVCSPHRRTSSEKSKDLNKVKGVTPLHQASQLAMESVAEVLLEAGADIHARTEQGETPLHLAALHSGSKGLGEATGLLRLLLKAGARVEAITTVGGFSPLHLAAVAGDALCTSVLLSAGARLDVQDFAGDTPLHKACQRIVSPQANRVRTVKLLLMKGASARVVNKEGLTPLHVLLMMDGRRDDADQEVLRLLLNHHQAADPDLPTPSGEAPLLVALRHRIHAFAKELVEKGADPNVCCTQDGQTPLHYVCRAGHMELFKLILSKGGDPARLDKEGLTPLYCAVKNGDASMIQACVCSGVTTSPQPRGDVIGGGGAFLFLEDIFENPEQCRSPLSYAFASAQSSLLVTLFQSGCCSLRELHTLREMCSASSLQTLTGPQQQAVRCVLHLAHSPPSLQNWCRWAVSRLIGWGAERKSHVQELGLPTLLQDFVLFKNV